MVARTESTEADPLAIRMRSGLYYVAEVTSRLVDKPGFIALICSFGFELVEHVSLCANPCPGTYHD